MKLRLLAAIILIFISPAAADTPENITLELQFDANQIYIDGSEITSSSYATQDFKYPYIVSGQPTGIVSYSEASKIYYKNISTTEDKFGITQNSGSFLIPHTKGGHQVIKDKEDEVKSRNLLNNINPSFGYPTPTNTFVKVSYIFPHKIASFEGRRTDIRQLTVRNKINGKKEIELSLRGS